MYTFFPINFLYFLSFGFTAKQQSPNKVSGLVVATVINFFEFSKTLNNIFSYQDKIDFICCAFEVAFSDGELHYIEEHFIKKIANSLNVEHKDLIKSKIEMKNYL